MKLIHVCLSVREDHWKQFAEVSAARGLSVSANVRQMVVEFLRRERKACIDASDVPAVKQSRAIGA